MIAREYYDNTLEIRLDVGKGNLLALSHLEQLNGIITEAAADIAINGLIITGTGHSFSTGLDLPVVLTAAEGKPLLDHFYVLDKLLIDLFRFPKPFVAAINGHSVGAGFLIQLCSDCALVADNSRIKIGLPELSLGLTIDSVMAHLAGHSCPSTRVLQNLLYSSDLYGPDKALQIGVVDEIVASESLLSTARGRVVRLLRGSLAAFWSTKQTLRRDTIHRMENALATNSHFVFDELLRQMKPGQAT